MKGPTFSANFKKRVRQSSEKIKKMDEFGTNEIHYNGQFSPKVCSASLITNSGSVDLVPTCTAYAGPKPSCGKREENLTSHFFPFNAKPRALHIETKSTSSSFNLEHSRPNRSPFKGSILDSILFATTIGNRTHPKVDLKLLLYHRELVSTKTLL